MRRGITPVSGPRRSAAQAPVPGVRRLSAEDHHIRGSRRPRLRGLALPPSGAMSAKPFIPAIPDISDAIHTGMRDEPRGHGPALARPADLDGDCRIADPA